MGMLSNFIAGAASTGSELLGKQALEDMRGGGPVPQTAPVRLRKRRAW